MLQGDTLAPFLFIVSLDYTLRRAKARRGASVHPTEACESESLSEDGHWLRLCRRPLAPLWHCEKECKNIGLGLNAKKTKVMPINTKVNEVNVKTINGIQLDVADDFKYLGSWVESGAHYTEHDIRIRRAQAWKVLHDMKKIGKSRLSAKTTCVCSLSRKRSSLLLWSLVSYFTNGTQDRRSLYKNAEGGYQRFLGRPHRTTWHTSSGYRQNQSQKNGPRWSLCPPPWAGCIKFHP